MTSQTIILVAFEVAASITGFIYWKKIKDSFWKWLPFYLGIIGLSEVIAAYLYEHRQPVLATGLYRYFVIPMEFVFLYWLFYKYFKEAQIKNNWPLYSTVIYLLCWLVDLLYIEGKMKLLFDSFSYVVGNIMLLLLLLVFFISFIKSDELLNYKSSNMFWITVGLLVFYLGSLPFWGLRTTLYRQYRDLFYVYWDVQFGLNYLMYSFFIISFIWGKPRSKYLLS